MLPALLSLLHHCERLLALIGRQYGENLRLGALPFDREVAHQLGLLVGVGADLGFVEGAGRVAGLGQAILVKLLPEGLSFGLLRLQDILDLGLLLGGQVKLRSHALEHPITMAAMLAALRYLSNCGCQAGCYGQYNRSNNEKLLVHYQTPLEFERQLCGPPAPHAVEAGRQLPLVLTRQVGMGGYDLLISSLRGLHIS
jgi:hypothetical protein